MATALAERERDRRGLDIDIVTGGVDPGDSIHDDVVGVLNEEGMDISDREPRKIEPSDVEDAAYIVTMGCSVDQFRPDNWTGENQEWELKSADTREQFAELSTRVSQFFDHLEQEIATKHAESEGLN